jgi:hypothetical protein
MRSAALSDDGTVFIPAAIAGHEQQAVLCATWDGTVPLVIDDDHAYLPAQWMAREYPEIADICHVIEEQTKAHFGGGDTQEHDH